MQKCLLLLFLFITSAACAQKGVLFVKKKGFKKVASFSEGDPFRFRTNGGGQVEGYISLIKNDSIYVNGMGYHQSSIRKIIVRKKEKIITGEQLLYVTAGVALSTTGMTLAKWASFGTALATSAVLGYGNILVRYLFHFRRSQYRIGKKFTVQTLDLHF